MGLLTKFNNRIHKIRILEESYVPTGRWFNLLVNKINSFTNLAVDTFEGVLDAIDTPSKNSTDNENIADSIGNREDWSFSDSQDNPSVLGHLKAGYYHVHSKARVYPELADAVTVTSAGTGWAYGTKVELIPADTINTLFDIHWVVVSDISAVDQYELSLYSGASGEEELIGTITFSRSSNFSQEGNLPIQVAPILSGTRITAALACKSTNARTCGVKIYYHTYPDAD